VCSSSAVMNISKGEIDRPILSMSGGNGNRRLIAAQDDGHKHGPVCCSIFGNDVLQILMSFGIRMHMMR
jgi:hypothetical protein